MNSSTTVSLNESYIEEFGGKLRQVEKVKSLGLYSVVKYKDSLHEFIVLTSAVTTVTRKNEYSDSLIYLYTRMDYPVHESYAGFYTDYVSPTRRYSIVRLLWECNHTPLGYVRDILSDKTYFVYMADLIKLPASFEALSN